MKLLNDLLDSSLTARPSSGESASHNWLTKEFNEVLVLLLLFFSNRLRERQDDRLSLSSFLVRLLDG